MAEALALAARIAANPGTALRLTKRLLREGQHTRLESLLEMSAGVPGGGAQDGASRRGGERLRREAQARFLGRLARLQVGA